MKKIKDFCCFLKKILNAVRETRKPMLTRTFQCKEEVTTLIVKITPSASPSSDTFTHANVLFQSDESDYPLPATDIP